MLQEVCSQAALSTDPPCQQRDPQVGIKISAGTVLNQSPPAILQELPTGRGDLMVTSTSETRLSLAHDTCLHKSLECRNGCSRRKPGRLLQFVGSRYSTIDQRQHKQIEVGPAALVTFLRHAPPVYEPPIIVIEPRARFPSIPSGEARARAANRAQASGRANRPRSRGWV